MKLNIGHHARRSRMRFFKLLALFTSTLWIACAGQAFADTIATREGVPVIDSSLEFPHDLGIATYAALVVIPLLLIVAFVTIWFRALNRQVAQRTRDLSESEERFRMICENAPVLIDAFDASGRCVIWNKRCRETFGWSMDEINAHGNALELFYPDPAVREEVVRTTTTDPDEQFREWRPVTKDGRTLTTTWANFRLPDGLTFNLGHDITAQKRDQDDLRQSESHLRALIDGLPDLVWLKSPDGVYLSCNQRFESFYGSPEAEIVGKTDHDFVDAEQADFFREQDNAAIAAGGPRVNEEELTFAVDGHQEWVETVKTPFYDSDGNLAGVLGIARDITDRKAMEKDHARLSMAIEQSDEIVIITDQEGAIQYVNPVFETVTGYTREEAVGKNPRFLKGGQQGPGFYMGLWKALLRGEVWKGQLVNKKKGGDLFTVDAAISAVKDSAGKTVSYVSVNRDVTEKLEVQAHLRHGQRMEAIGQLAGGVAHDFNNILQVIFTNVQLSMDGPPRAELLDNLSQIEDAAEKAAGLTRQLLMFGRRQLLRPKNIDLNEAIVRSLKMLHRLIGEHIQVDFVPGNNLGIIHADQGSLEQVLMNLCINARDAMPGGGRLRIKTENVAISDPTRGRDGDLDTRVMVEVSDTGHGMSLETQSHIFEPFFTTKAVDAGTGLGLATVYGIVTQHGGTIEVASELERGSTFKVYWPQAEGQSPDAHVESETKSEGGTETILVAEDDPAVQKSIVRMLKKGGYTVLVASDGEEVLELFEANAQDISLVVLDVLMPKLGGRLAFERIRAMDPNMPGIFSSGYSVDGVHNRFILEEDLELIQKPYRSKDLLGRVRKVLDAAKR